MKILIENVSKSYGEKLALDNVSLEFTEGIYGILGPNGAGKSTFMNILTDNIRRDGGKVLLDGTDILDMGKDYRSLIGYMPQEQGLYGAFSARKYLYYVASLKGIKRKEAKEQVEEVLSVVGLSDVAHKKTGSFSGGMKQRVMLASALIGNPKILILDEPTAGLDPKERIRIRNFIAGLAVDRIVLLATHVVSDVECIAKEVILLKNGKIAGKDTPYRLIETVADRVWEKKCDETQMLKYQEMYGVGNIFQRKDGVRLRILADEKPEGFEKAEGTVGLEDVYLYYMEYTKGE